MNPPWHAAAKDDKPVTAQARADSAHQDVYEGFVSRAELMGHPVAWAPDEYDFAGPDAPSAVGSADSVTMSENAKKRTIADAISRGMAVAENMKQVYRMSRYRDDDVETGIADAAVAQFREARRRWH